MIELKPCPFCGGSVELLHTTIMGNENYTIQCMGCRTYFNNLDWAYADEKDVVEDWNRRVIE